jgi:hypothetical protein
MGKGEQMGKKLRPAVKTMESMMSPESVQQARLKAEQETLTIKLSQLREKCGVKQTGMDNFTQTSVSRIEKRRDIKISTLINYLDALDMGLEIRAYPKKSMQSAAESEVLLRI